jgi:hypothetical protein
MISWNFLEISKKVLWGFAGVPQRKKGKKRRS